MADTTQALTAPVIDSSTHVYGLRGVPGCVEGFMPCIDADAAAIETLAGIYAEQGRKVSIVLVPRCRAAQWLRARANEVDSVGNERGAGCYRAMAERVAA